MIVMLCFMHSLWFKTCEMSDKHVIHRYACVCVWVGGAKQLNWLTHVMRY